MRASQSGVTALAIALVSIPMMAASEQPPPETLYFVFPGKSPIPNDTLATAEWYGSFYVAALSAAEHSALTAEGHRVEPLPLGTGRGAIFGDFVADPPHIPPSLQATDAESRFIVQFRGPAKGEWIDALHATAEEVYGYLPHFAYLVRLNETGRAAVADIPTVRVVIPHHPAFKIPSVNVEAEWGPFLIVAFPDASIASLESELRALEGTGLRVHHLLEDVVVTGDFPWSSIDKIAALSDVRTILVGDSSTGRSDNENATALVQTGYDVGNFTRKVYANGVDGSTQIVQACDSGIRTKNWNVLNSTLRAEHEMFADDQGLGGGYLKFNAHLSGDLEPHRKINLYWAPQGGLDAKERNDTDGVYGHGSHVSGVLAGDAPPFGTYNKHDGIAFNAKLIVCDLFGNQYALDQSSMWDVPYSRGANITSHSNTAVGEEPGKYQLLSRQQDLFSWNHPRFLILRSIGNSGQPGVMNEEAVAKNVVAVGASESVILAMANQTPGNVDKIYWGQSTGNTTDGRFKPTVVAPGPCVNSSTRHGVTTYECYGATSQSTPLVAGSGALIRDYFEKGFYPTGSATVADKRTVTAALVKALLVVSAEEVSEDFGRLGYPNGAQGWGRVNLDDALYFAADDRKLIVVDEDTQTLTVGETYRLNVTVGGSQPFRVALVWRDYPGIECSTDCTQPVLVNDLDLTVYGPSGAEYVGNTFVDGVTPSNGGTRDALNNEEGIIVASPPDGTYRVEVRATSLGSPSREGWFALAITGEVA